MDRYRWLCPTIFFVVLVGVLAGVGALIGVLFSQTETCCMAVKACWNGAAGRILEGPCKGPLQCDQILDYADKCYSQQQPIILYYTGLGAAFGVGLILAAGLICLIGALFGAENRKDMKVWFVGRCTICRRTDYTQLL